MSPGQESPAAQAAALPAPEVVLGMRRARIAARSRRYDEALAQIDRVVAAHPGVPEALLARAEILARSGAAADKVREAWLATLRALEARSASVHVEVAERLLDELDDRDGLERLLEVVRGWRRVAPGNDRVEALETGLLEALGAWEEVLDRIRTRRGLARSERQRRRTCLKALEAAIRARRWEEVLEYSRCAGEFHPLFDDLPRVRALIALKRFDEAVELIAGLPRRLDGLRLNDEPPRVHVRYAWMIHDEAGPEYGERAFRALLRVFPRSEELRRTVALMYGGEDEAASAGRAGTVLDGLGGRPAKLVQEAALLIAAGDHAGALPLLEQAVMLEPGLLVAHQNLAVAAIALERWDVARRSLDLVLSRSPDDTMALYNSGLVAVRMQDFERAVRDLDHLLQLSPGFTDAHYYLYKAHRALGHEQQAAEHLRRYREARARQP
ncbi:MAG: hypothetical protein Kow0062_20450 [Acidobacteriota bacterium]